jgi:Ca-activated chloride channel family protein
MNGMEFQYPQVLWLLLLLLPLAYHSWNSRNERKASLQFSVTQPFLRQRSWRSYLAEYLPLLRIPVIALLLIALARPREEQMDVKRRSSEGIDIVLAIDVSASMLAKDLRPNRLDATKEVAKQFISDRVGDRIGLVAYAGESYTMAPITTDHRVLFNSLEELSYGKIQDGTAIGMGLATAVNRLKDGQGDGRVIILLTDGVNNTGSIDPMTSADLAEAFGLKTYTIGVGTNGMASTPVSIDASGRLMYQKRPVEIDEELLQEIAKKTGGQYFRATNNESLQAIYQEIDKLEKKEVEELRYYAYTELFRPFMLWAFGLLFLEVLLKNTLLRSLN